MTQVFAGALSWQQFEHGKADPQQRLPEHHDIVRVSSALLFITGFTHCRLEVCLSLGSGEAGPFIAAAGLYTLEVLPCQMQA